MALISQSIPLRHQFSSRQILSLDNTVQAVEELLRLKSIGWSDDSRSTALSGATAVIDNCCLDLCISLLDHELKGDLFESVVVGFFAVSAIDPQRGILKEAYQYTSVLSGFVKIAQIIILQTAVEAADRGEIDHPADLLGEMRERFMIHGTRSPFNWASRLRTYGKKVRDSTTSLGYIEWTDGEECVTYREVRNLQMGKFKDFVRGQVAKAQDELEALLHIHPEETRKELGIRF